MLIGVAWLAILPVLGYAYNRILLTEETLPLCTATSIRNSNCAKNDTYCGEWKGREWHPSGCRYRSFTGAQARQCMGNRTIACIGDSIIRDICIGVAFFLSDEKVADGLDFKFDKKAEIHSHFTNATKIGDFKRWGLLNKSNYNGLLFPKIEDRKTDWHWQVQVWELYCNYYLHNNHVQDVLSNKMMEENADLRKIDLAFWSHGLHDYGWWDHPPFAQRFFEQMPGQWMRVVKEIPYTPCVWVAMNPECLEDMKGPGAGGPERAKQVHMVEEANWYTHQKLREAGLPYWDAAAPLRSPQRCDVSSDGVHVKMWVDLVRANILFNHLCDENYNWVGGIDRFN